MAKLTDEEAQALTVEIKGLDTLRELVERLERAGEKMASKRIRVPAPRELYGICNGRMWLAGHCDGLPIWGSREDALFFASRSAAEAMLDAYTMLPLTAQVDVLPQEEKESTSSTSEPVRTEERTTATGALVEELAPGCLQAATLTDVDPQQRYGIRYRRLWASGVDRGVPDWGDAGHAKAFNSRAEAVLAMAECTWLPNGVRVDILPQEKFRPTTLNDVTGPCSEEDAVAGAEQAMFDGTDEAPAASRGWGVVWRGAGDGDWWLQVPATDGRHTWGKERSTALAFGEPGLAAAWVRDYFPTAIAERLPPVEPTPVCRSEQRLPVTGEVALIEADSEFRYQPALVVNGSRIFLRPYSQWGREQAIASVNTALRRLASIGIEIGLVKLPPP